MTLAQLVEQVSEEHRVGSSILSGHTERKNYVYYISNSTVSSTNYVIVRYISKICFSYFIEEIAMLTPFNLREQLERERREIEEIPKREVQVVLTCNKEYVAESSVRFLNIEEDYAGRDLLTFICPECGQVHKSFRLG